VASFHRRSERGVDYLCASGLWPLLITPLQNELRLLNRPIHEVLLCQIRLVGLDRLDQLPRAQERRGEKNGVLPFFDHWVSPREFAAEEGARVYTQSQPVVGHLPYHYPLYR
jgi:hypothetical protein